MAPECATIAGISMRRLFRTGIRMSRDGRPNRRPFRRSRKKERILGSEALAYNPAIQLYRHLTPDLSTEFERKHILSLKELRFAKRWFRVLNVRFFLMTAPLFTLLPTGMLRRRGIALGHAIDAVATRIPLVQLLSWQTRTP